MPHFSHRVPSKVELNNFPDIIGASGLDGTYYAIGLRDSGATNCVDAACDGNVNLAVFRRNFFHHIG